MSEWQFASREGILVWSSPAMIDGSQELYSQLSPTLLMGYQQQGDPIPLDFIKLSSVVRVELGGRDIELIRNDGGNMTLTAMNSSDAHEWVRMIELAMQGMNSATPATTVAVERAPPSTAPVAAPAPAPRNDPPPQQREYVAGPESSAQSSSAQPRAGNGWSASSYEQFSHQLENDPNNTDKQSPRRDRGDVAPHHSEPDPYGEVVAPPPSKNLGSSAPPPAAADSHTAAPTSDAGLQWASPRVQQPAAQPQQQESHHEHDFRPVSNFTDGAVASTTTVTQHDEIRYPNATNPAGPPTPQPIDPRAGSRPLPTDVSAIPGGRYTASQSQPGLAMGNTSLMGQSNAPYNNTSNNMGGGYTPAGARRGMMVDVPASQTYNRNLAPNSSAVWKEWSDPDGCTYVFHEATQTLQRRIPDSNEFETLVEGTGIISEEDLAQRPNYTGNETTVNVDARTVRNMETYGMNSGGSMMHSVGPMPEGPSNRGQYSPTRRTQVEVFAAPQRQPSGYTGRRVHKLTLDGVNNKSTVEHQVQSLESAGLMWDPKSGNAMNASHGASRGEVGMSTLQRQWEHVRKILLQGRYFKKHALRSTQASFRYVFLTSDNSFVVCVPTSEVLLNVSDRDSQQFGSVTETIQYFGGDSRAIALNTITHVSLGSEEDYVRRRPGLIPENVFCIVSRTHAFVLECNTHEEAKYFCDAWTFFLYHSKPLNPKKQKTPQMVAPVNFGLRGGIKW